MQIGATAQIPGDQPLVTVYFLVTTYSPDPSSAKLLYLVPMLKQDTKELPMWSLRLVDYEICF